MREAVVAIIFVLTIAALYVRPLGARDWHVALAGAVLTWAASPLSLAAGLREIRDSWNIEAFFLGLMLLAAGAESAGLYARAAHLLMRYSRGRARVATVVSTGTAITAILSNDATPLILTPAVFAAGAAGDAATASTAFAVTLIADGASMLLPISNPVGLLFYERFGLTPGDWMLDIFPAAVAAVVVLAGLVVWRAGSACPAAAEPRQAFQDRPNGLTRAALVLFGVLAVGYAAAAVSGIDLGPVTLAGGTVLMVAVLCSRVSLDAYRRTASPGLLIFVAALLLLVRGVSAAGVLDWLTTVFHWLGAQPSLLAIVGAALSGMVLSNIVNNWPASVILAAVIATGQAAQPALVVGAVIGCTAGANLTVVGSLSTVFWLSLCRQSGARYTAAEYARRAFAPTLGATAAACLVASVALAR